MSKRRFLLLQGPPGPMFRDLGRSLEAHGAAVFRINLNGGDVRDWPDATASFRGRFSSWPVFIDEFLRRHAITDLLLFGDCRPHHVTAHGLAEMRGIRTHVLEEGYLRPHWMTLEREGVNARSLLSRDKNWFRAQARILPPEEDLRPVTASFGRRARDSYWHYHRVVTGRLRFPHYRSHRSGSIIGEGLGWLWKFLRQPHTSARANEVLARLTGKPLFVMPLQLSGDYQIRAHSSFPDMKSAARYVIQSFAHHAPAEAHLLLKTHPLDCSFFDWGGFVRREAHRLGLADRLHYADGGDLDAIIQGARGLVCVNSTSATLALARGIPVCTIGEAIYDMDGLTHQGHLDTFWSAPTPSEPGLYEAFRRVLVDRCLVRGGLASESAVATLVKNLTNRLLDDPLAGRETATIAEMPLPRAPSEHSVGLGEQCVAARKRRSSSS